MVQPFPGKSTAALIEINVRPGGAAMSGLAETGLPQ
jgi:hypothetical protein